jgi:xylulokinase
MTHDSFLLGIDLGTSGVKVILLPADVPEAKPIAEATVGYPLSTPRPGWSEQNPADWWDGVTQAIRTALAAGGIAPAQPARRSQPVAALALSGQMHGATLLDARGQVLRPCILWNDARSGPQCVEITARVGLDNLLRWAANPALAGFTAPKILWVREHEPEVYARLATVLLPKDYINYRLTGELATEVSDASGTLLFDVAHRRWSEKMLQALDLSPGILPAVHASTDVIGRVTAEAAAATGLAAGTPVVAGGADNACAAVGLGVVRAGQVATSIGTSGTVIAPSAEPRLDPQARLHTFCHAVPDTWYLMGVVLSAGGSLRWFRDTLAGEEVRQAVAEGRDPYDVILAEAAAVPAGSEGLFFLPYLSGERTPHGDPDARGVFFGLSLRHTRAHLARSVIEGVTFALADSTDLMRALGLDLSVVRATGGGARSAFWRQLQADVLHARVVTALADVGPAFGASILAGTGVGVFESVTAATDRLVRVGEEVAPDPDAVELYRRHHALYDRLYPALKPEFAAAARL